jgi:hypothetical protein
MGKQSSVFNSHFEKEKIAINIGVHLELRAKPAIEPRDCAIFFRSFTEFPW